MISPELKKKVQDRVWESAQSMGLQRSESDACVDWFDKHYFIDANDPDARAAKNGMSYNNTEWPDWWTDEPEKLREGFMEKAQWPPKMYDVVFEFFELLRQFDEKAAGTSNIFYGGTFGLFALFYFYLKTLDIDRFHRMPTWSQGKWGIVFAIALLVIGPSLFISGILARRKAKRTEKTMQAKIFMRDLRNEFDGKR